MVFLGDLSRNLGHLLNILNDILIHMHTSSPKTLVESI